MPRKRASTRSRSKAKLVDLTMPCADAEVYEYEYYTPGYYHIPQVVRQATTYTYDACSCQYRPPWSAGNAATYVVDPYGMVNYLSDFEHLLQLPNILTLQTEITTYHYHCDKSERDEEDINNEEDTTVIPQKKERNECEEEFEHLYDESDPSYDQIPTNTPQDQRNTPESNRVYRSEEGYLVEEPIDEPDEPAPDAPTSN